MSVSSNRQTSRTFNIWPNMKFFVTDEVRYLIEHHEEWVLYRGGRQPSGRPLLCWPDGRIRIEFGQTFKSVAEAYDKVKADLEERDLKNFYREMRT